MRIGSVVSLALLLVVGGCCRQRCCPPPRSQKSQAIAEGMQLLDRTKGVEKFLAAVRDRYVREHITSAKELLNVTLDTEVRKPREWVVSPTCPGEPALSAADHLSVIFKQALLANLDGTLTDTGLQEVTDHYLWFIFDPASDGVIDAGSGAPNPLGGQLGCGQIGQPDSCRCIVQARLFAELPTPRWGHTVTRLTHGH